MVGAIVGVHVVAVWGLLQVREVRDAVIEAAPIFVSLMSPEKAPEKAPDKPPEPVPPPPVPQPKREPPPRLVAAAPTPAPATPAFVVPPPVEEPPPVVVAAAPPVAVPAPAPAPPAPVQPKIIPASAVQYLEAPVLQYPRLSVRFAETGRVLVRVFIDEQGHAKNVQVNRSSGHPRLDEAGLAAVQKARFKPYTENGQPVAGWAFIPLDFELEK